VDLVHNRLDLDESKTDWPRSWDMRRDVLEALKVWRHRLRPKAAAGDCVLVDEGGAGLNVDHLAAQLRADLRRADGPVIAQRLPSKLRITPPSTYRKLPKVHGKGVEPLRLSAAEPKAERKRSDRRNFAGFCAFE
jgi:hypothetical protein